MRGISSVLTTLFFPKFEIEVLNSHTHSHKVLRKKGLLLLSIKRIMQQQLLFTTSKILCRPNFCKLFEITVSQKFCSKKHES